MKVLHITNWYPTYDDPVEAVWIYRHIDALNKFCNNEVIHLEVKDKGFSIRNKKQVLGNKSIILNLPTNKWLIKEIGYFVILAWILLIQRRISKYDLINIHIAYPLCTFLYLIKRFIKVPLVITEHWSAYHLNFGVEKKNKLNRIKNIFSMGLPVITVSKALGNDIAEFSGYHALDNFVVPNVVDVSVHKFENENTEPSSYFMVSKWKEPKDPFAVINAFANLKIRGRKFKLIIGGYGPQEEKIVQIINEMHMRDCIEYVGKLNKFDIAANMNKADYFIHLSRYETFSVVCAEALCCGTPVIASNVGGIPELIDNNNGILLENNSVSTLVRVMEQIMDGKYTFIRHLISDSAHKVFSTENVGRKYYDVLLNIISKYHAE